MKIIGRLANPHLVSPYRHAKYMHEGRYSAVLILSENTAADVAVQIAAIARERWQDSYYQSCLRRGPRVDDLWRVVASNRDMPITRDHMGMPDRPDIFESDQTVEADIKLYAYEMDILHRNPINMRGVSAILLSLRLLGGIIRGID